MAKIKAKRGKNRGYRYKHISLRAEIGRNTSTAGAKAFSACVWVPQAKYPGKRAYQGQGATECAFGKNRRVALSKAMRASAKRLVEWRHGAFAGYAKKRA